MSDSLKNDDKSIRSYILNDVCEKVSIDESYVKLCKVIGKDAITFHDFQYWYYRFKNGERDLDFDRSLEPKPLQFSNLPLDAVELIVDKLELKERWMLRLVSKPFRDFMEQLDVSCDSIQITCGSNFVNLCSFRMIGITYTKSRAEFEKIKCNKYLHDHVPVVLGDSYESEAFNDLKWILKNPKLQLKCFTFSYGIHEPTKFEEEYKMVKRCCERIDNILKSLKHQVAVKLISIQLSIRSEYADNLLAILPYLKPGYLESISISKLDECDFWENAESSQKLQKIVSLDQWNQARSLWIKNLFGVLDRLPGNDAFTHFESLHVREMIYQPGVLVRLRDIIAKSETLVKCTLYNGGSYKREDFKIGVPGPAAPLASKVRQYMIPNSNQYLEFKFYNCFGNVVIVKKTRE